MSPPSFHASLVITYPRFRLRRDYLATSVARQYPQLYTAIIRIGEHRSGGTALYANIRIAPQLFANPDKALLLWIGSWSTPCSFVDSPYRQFGAVAKFEHDKRVAYGRFISRRTYRDARSD